MNEHYERLCAMRDDNGLTWDLSENDREALRWALRTIDTELARADEAERLLRLTCLQIVDGVEHESLPEMRSHQSNELADISIAIGLAWNKLLIELERTRKA